MTNLEELKRLAELATPGPWEWWTSNSCKRLTGRDGRDGGVISAVMHARWPDIQVSQENAAFIAAAYPAVVLKLIAEIERLQTEQSKAPAMDIERMKEALASPSIPMPPGLSREEKLAYILKHADD